MVKWSKLPALSFSDFCIPANTHRQCSSLYLTKNKKKLNQNRDICLLISLPFKENSICFPPPITQKFTSANETALFITLRKQEVISQIIVQLMLQADVNYTFSYSREIFQTFRSHFPRFCSFLFHFYMSTNYICCCRTKGCFENPSG